LTSHAVYDIRINEIYFDEDENKIENIVNARSMFSSRRWEEMNIIFEKGNEYIFILNKILLDLNATIDYSKIAKYETGLSWHTTIVINDNEYKVPASLASLAGNEKLVVREETWRELYELQEHKLEELENNKSKGNISEKEYDEEIENMRKSPINVYKRSDSGFLDDLNAMIKKYKEPIMEAGDYAKIFTDFIDMP